MGRGVSATKLNKRKQDENQRWVGEFEFLGEVCIFPGATHCFLKFKIIIASKFLVLAKVRHSQQMNEALI